jgi:hypothetical protein
VLVRKSSPTHVVEALRDDVQRFAQGVDQADDLTVLALRWLART